MSPAEWEGYVDSLLIRLRQADPSAPEALAQAFALLEPRVLGAPSPPESLSYSLYAAARELGVMPDAQRPLARDALDILAVAREAARRYDYDEVEADVEFRAGSILIARGELARARSLLERALPAYPEAAESLPWIRILLAEVLRRSGSWERALRLLDEAEASLLDESHGLPAHRFARAYLFGVRGLAFLDMGLPDRAAPWFAEERRLAEALGDAEALLNARLNAANLKLATGHLDALGDEIDELMGQEELLDRDPRTRATFQLYLAFVRSEQARLDPAREDEAVRLFTDALATAYLDPGMAFRARIRLAELLARSGRALDEWVALLDEAETQLAGWRRAEGFVEPAPEVASLAALRARAVLEGGGDRAHLERALADLQAAFEPFLAWWDEVPEREGGVAYLEFGERQGVLSELVRLHLAVDGEVRGAQRGLELLMRVQTFGSLARRAGLTAGSLEEVQRELCAGGTGLLVYFPSIWRSHLFCVDAEGVLHLELPERDVIEEARRELLASVRRSPQERSERASMELERLRGVLTELLLPDEALARLEGWSTVSIVGQDLLGYLPFECLFDGNGRELGRAKATAYLPSLPVGLWLARRAREGEARTYGSDLWLLAAPEHGPRVSEEWPELPPLAWNAARTASLFDHYPEGAARSWVGPEATADPLRALVAGSTRVLHLVTHGVYDPARERPAGMVFSAPDPRHPGVVWCEDADRIVAPPLVVLSACGAARGPLRRGDDGVAHLGGSFLGAGAQAVVLSHADLEYESMLTMMAAFHRHLRVEGVSPAEALRRAREDLAAKEGWSDPFYHALIHVSGLADRPLFPEGFPEKRRAPAGGVGRWILLGLAASAGLGLFARRRWRARAA